MRCHSQAFTVKLRRDVPIGEIESLLEKQGLPRDLAMTLAKATVVGAGALAEAAGRPGHVVLAEAAVLLPTALVLCVRDVRMMTTD